jgi:hypothetical protein
VPAIYEVLNNVLFNNTEVQKGSPGPSNRFQFVSSSFETNLILLNDSTSNVCFNFSKKKTKL